MLHINRFFFLPALQIQGDEIKVLKDGFASYSTIVLCAVQKKTGLHFSFHCAAHFKCNSSPLLTAVSPNTWQSLCTGSSNLSSLSVMWARDLDLVGN